MKFFRMEILASIGLAACVFFGAGCQKSPVSSSPPIPSRPASDFKQPAQAEAPSKQPVIPAEAAKIPKPY